MSGELISVQLKDQTLIPHRELEKLLMQRMRGMTSVNDYLMLLKVFYSYLGGIEDQINVFIGTAHLPDYHERRKSAALAADILTLGGELPQKTSPDRLPLINNLLQAFGALYVLEGSTLGGVIISKMLGKQLGIEDEQLTFFRSYGDMLVAMWATFKIALDALPKNQGEKDIIILAASETFLKFRIALER